MNDDQQNYDVVVVGGGIVGAAAALNLARCGWSVALLEHKALLPFDDNSPPDLRVSAINYTTIGLLKQPGVWARVQQMRYAPYRRLETWELSGSEVIFDAAFLALPELGFMVENRVLQLALWQQMKECNGLTLLCPAELKNMRRIDDHWQLTLDRPQQLKTRLIIGSDGPHSLVRRLAGIGTSGWQYRQACMLVTVETETPQQETTWQQFFPSGPRAFLPLFGHWASLAWYDSPQRIRQLQAMPLSQLNQEITRAFPARLGKVNAIATGSFPLTRCHAQHYVESGLALLGDAAHTINPLAGQGVNLGYKDVDALIDVLNQARELTRAWYSKEVLLRYQYRRRRDNLLMQSGMDLFYTAFSNSLLPVKIVRNLALMAAQRAGKLKEYVLKYALGL
ncbi:3-demethoxyubiquinol 3-hydroxylase [Candidatus Fukatsuia symbiotica]|uniref:2-octaprenyl-3-methyl-6-methoxy-1,4-benzoquinol hydroxylase n=1 Tax=Candidatus Fukatsuia symbiotica TaxID=1878942 RepID=A0A2U8I7W9_9GAMM|nr:3-demethoxyubiquinol 3-hydroxylase [Candidatus Fukatsuia symbiotica]AWK15217.1 2-octaprenyl-3-methyl-6-methoxy-1,4-benzoquinol hydroxylase [Candidatus Fukatsuia symbiotica]MEA9444050.1 3-demethoxyubiquinol 3-hydroxylase [Candidatus Fukatsuia symbiotica]